MRTTQILLLSVFASRLSAYDCSRSKPFEEFEQQSVSIKIDRFYWMEENLQKVEKTEAVCETTKPFEIGAYDIRGREEEWYYCFYQKQRPSLVCDTTFLKKPAQIVVRPAVVVRKYSEKSVRDIHAHIFLLPEKNIEKYFDTFIRSLSFELRKAPAILDGVSGGRGPESNQDSYGVRLQYV